MKCPGCKAEMPDNIKYCHSCGKELNPPKVVSYADLPPGTILVCPKCGTKNMRTDARCRNCDLDLTQTKTAVAKGIAIDPKKFKAQCLKCGSENPVDAKYCGSCGWTIVGTPMPGPGLGIKYPSDRLDEFTKAMFYIFSLVVPIVGAIIAAILINAGRDPGSDYRSVGGICLILSFVNLVFLLLLMALGVVSSAFA